MPTEISLKLINSSVTEGCVTNIKVEKGQQVKKGDIFAEIETDKATMELESPADGVALAVLVDKGQNLNAESVMLVVGDQGEEISDDYLQSLKKKIVFKTTDNKASKAKIDTNYDDLLPRTPDLSKIKLGDTVPVSRIQKLVGNLMLQSKHEIPCFYLTTDVLADNLIAHRKKLNKEQDTKLSYNDFIIKAMAAGIEKYPVMSGKLDGDQILLDENVNISLAIAAGDDLFAPVVQSVNTKTVGQISSDISLLVEKARAFTLGKEDLQGGCCTLSNLGSFGIDSFVPIVVPGECFILGVGKISPSPIVARRELAEIQKFSMTISVDHRIANGAIAAQFLDFVKKLLENPESLI